jgi:hypothetical protein
MQETNKIVNTVLSIQPREAGAAGGKSPEELVEDLAEDILGRVPKLLSIDDARPELMQTNDEGLLPSLTVVLMQEMDRFNRLLVRMRKSLVDIRKAIKGEVVMSLDLDRMFSSLLNNQVPQLWAAVAYPSLKPLGSWVVDLLARVVFMRKWLTEGQPLAFWLSGFFFPQGFMTGSLQTHARKTLIPIDQCVSACVCVCACSVDVYVYAGSTTALPCCATSTPRSRPRPRTACTCTGCLLTAAAGMLRRTAWRTRTRASCTRCARARALPRSCWLV